MPACDPNFGETWRFFARFSGTYGTADEVGAGGCQPRNSGALASDSTRRTRSACRDRPCLANMCFTCERIVLSRRPVARAAARRTALTCDQDARTRDPDTLATRQWICLGGRSWCAARAHRPGGGRGAPSTRGRAPPSPQGARGEDARPNRAPRHTNTAVAASAAGRASVPTRRTAVPLGAAPGRTATA